MAPELFGDLDVLVPRRWTRDEPKPTSGRPARLNNAHLTVLGEIAHKIIVKVSMSAPAMMALFNMQLANLECEHQVSVFWTRSFIHKSSANIPEEIAIMYSRI
eukprot:4219790-Amphidinium_carterae.1